MGVCLGARVLFGLTIVVAAAGPIESVGVLPRGGGREAVKGLERLGTTCHRTPPSLPLSSLLHRLSSPFAPLTGRSADLDRRGGQPLALRTSILVRYIRPVMAATAGGV
jgi:hypothetical protein